MKTFNHIAARIFLGHIFLLAGISKLGAYAGTQGYMESVGVPGFLLPLVIALEIAGGLCVIVGFKAHIVSYILAGFTIVAALLFHNNFADQIQMIMFMKNIAIAGGFLLLANNGSGALSVDRALTNSGRKQAGQS